MAATGDTTRIEAVGPEEEGSIANILDSYGFISPDRGGENIFFHASELSGMRFRELRPGDRVTYVAAFNDRGPCAKRVEMVEAWREETSQGQLDGGEPPPEGKPFLSFAPVQPTGRA
jgi:CspA family cold shock protein